MEILGFIFLIIIELGLIFLMLVYLEGLLFDHSLLAFIGFFMFLIAACLLLHEIIYYWDAPKTITI